VEAFKVLRDEVGTRVYPEEKHTLKIKDNEFASFLKGLD